MDALVLLMLIMILRETDTFGDDEASINYSDDGDDELGDLQVYLFVLSVRLMMIRCAGKYRNPVRSCLVVQAGGGARGWEGGRLVAVWVKGTGQNKS